ncbi:unnamed protein product [Zymoseptoria tritici ST99CH_3D1]|nr:unnamed protein product [Zymoseptoria tritici ST99CH_3D1]
MRSLHLTALLASISHAAKYEEYILAPSSRTLLPAAIYQLNGTVSNPDSLLSNSTSSTAAATFTDASSLTLDFGKNIAGLVSFTVTSTSADQYIGLAYSESSLWVNGQGSDGTADAGIDEILWFQPTGPGNYTVDREHERGGFRYLSLIHNTTGEVGIDRVEVHFTPMPHWEEGKLREYTGWFHCDDELVNRVWYAGAYTNQLCTIDPHYGNALVHLYKINSTQLGDETPPNTWYNNFTITNGTSALVDGAKRDRLVWAGDMAIAVPAIVVSTDDMISVANSLDSLFAVQNTTTGQLSYAGVPFPSLYSSTYHLYTLIGVADYYLYANALPYLQAKWPAWKLALNYSLSFIDDSGMMNVTSPADWLRFGMGGHNIEANSILYYTINQGLLLGAAVHESPDLLAAWSRTAERIKQSANTLLWNDTTGLYHDNETTTLSPQDGNAWAVLANLTDSSEKNTRISTALRSRWGTYGAPAVEADDAISPFISGFELRAHLLAGNATSALDLIRLQWGFMLDDPRMTNSTFIEGYSSTGELHYAPYTNDPRVSHAHGWATGPTSTLTFEVGGLKLLSAGGATWEVAPRLGGLRMVDTGFSTSLGQFAVEVNATASGQITGFMFSTPDGTSGRVSLPGVSGMLRGGNGTTVRLIDGEASDVPGGTWTLVVGPEGSTGAAAVMSASSLLAAAAGIFGCALLL